MTDRFEIHCHFEWSNIRLLDSINRLKPTVKYAKEIGLKGLCVTDHASIAGWIKAVKLQEELGEEFKIGLGEEGYLVNKRESGIKYYHCIWIAKDDIGAKQIRKISSLAWMNSYFDRGMERVPITKEELTSIVEKDKGHIIVTTACIGGEVSSKILEMESARKMGDAETANKAKTDIINFVLWAKDLFGDDFYFEVAPAANKEQIIVNKKMIELSAAFGVKVVLGSDAHYLRLEDREVHSAFLNSKGGDRETAQFYEYAYLQTEEEIKNNLTPSIVDYYDTLCQNSIEIFDKIKGYHLLHPQQIPKVEVNNYPKADWDNIVPIKYPTLWKMQQSDDKVERYWVNECLNKLKELDKYNEIYLSRLEEEADTKMTISEKLGTNFFSYPVTLQHYVNLFWDCGSTVGAGRGSSCSGLNHFLLGITQLDPIEWELPFWRYSNKERIELGDIDIDIAPSKRASIIRAIKDERSQNFNEDIDELSHRNLGCTYVATFGTESSKSAILTACRGYRSEDCPNGVDFDTSTYLSSLIPSERGFVWSLTEVYYGTEERQKITSFVNTIDTYPGLIEIALGIEGIISRRGIHASGVIFQDEDPYNFGCYMKAPNGEIITQYDLHDAEAAGMTKYDFLVTSVQDKIVQCINFLQENGEIEKTLSLREVYNKYLHPSVLPIEDMKYWYPIQNASVIDLFQFDSLSGSQAAKKIKPTNILEMSDANGLMRLMAMENGVLPLDKYVSYKNNIMLWYKEMREEYHLTEEEIEAVKPHFARSHGVPPSQEQLMTMLMDDNICHFTLKEANDARKIVGKKLLAKVPALKEKVMTQAASENLGRYIWECGIGPQMSYSFSIIHALAYSFIGFQTAYLATRWNPIYWNTACLAVNSGSLEDEDIEIVSIYAKEDSDCEYEDLPDRSAKKKKDKGADYTKIAKAIGNIRSQGIKVSLLNINTSDYGFRPDIQHNRILYGLKPLSNINSDIINKIKANRPYTGIKDFMTRCPLSKVPIINLIKAGAFDEIDEDFNNRKEIMVYYLMNNCEAKKKLNMQNFNGLIGAGIIPKELELQIRVFQFNKYLKAYCKKSNVYIFNNDCISFFNRFLSEEIDKLGMYENNICINQIVWDKIYKKYMEVARQWIIDNHNNLLNQYNTILFKEVWDKYAKGSYSTWEMSALCFYYSPHELINISNTKYGLSDFNKLPSVPEVDYYFKRGGNQIPIFKLSKIIGTVIAKNDTKHIVTLLTTTGVVDVKFTGEYYSMFKKQISEIQPDGIKKVIEKSWFTRGVKLMITGFRREDTFVAKTYKSTGSHQLYKIIDVINDEMVLRHERATSNNSYEEEDYER